MWDEQKALSELESPEPEVLFVCGSSRNRDRFLPYFTKIFNLRIDDDTMRRRLQERTNNDFGKQPEELELMLRLNRSDEKPAGAIDVDATQPLDQVVDEVLRLANCRTVDERLDADTVVQTRVRDWSVIRDLRVRTPDRAGCCRPAEAHRPWSVG